MALDALLELAEPLIAVSFDDGSAPGSFERLRTAGLDVAELRVDRSAVQESAAVVEHAQQFAGIATIGTIRAASEGGEWSKSEQERLALYRALATAVDAVDVELAADEIRDDVITAAREHRRTVIASHHDFDRTPPRDALDEMEAAARAAGADLFKIAAQVTDDGDLRTLAQFTLDHADAGVIVVGMGPLGPASRILLPLLGSRLSYAHAGEHPVPGQMTFEETFAHLCTFSPAFRARHSR
jgi:3-dehydroquinate dehydratase-1